MNNTTPIKILTAAVLLTFGFALTANAALINIRSYQNES